MLSYAVDATGYRPTLEVKEKGKKAELAEEFLLFDIKKDPPLPNKDHQRLLSSFDVVPIALEIIK